MNKSYAITLGAALLLVLLLTYLEATEKEPVNWIPSYLETDKIALGTYVLYESWKETGRDPVKVDRPPYDFLDEEVQGTYFFLNNNLDFDKTETKKLLEWVSRGNDIFLSASGISKNLLDTLNLNTGIVMPGESFSSQPYVNLVHPDLRMKQPFKYEQELPMVYFIEIDTLNTTILGVTALKEFSKPQEAYPNFLEKKLGEGRVFLHTSPHIFGNYFMLSASGHQYAEALLSYLDPEKQVYWDKYYKAGNSFYSSPLYVLLQNRNLKWAYYFALGGCLIFIIFEGKRKQRPVPVVNALKNQTYEYSRTIAALYLERKEYRTLALKQVSQFLEYIRTRHRLDTSRLNDDLYRELAEKTKNSPEQVRQLFSKITEFSNKAEITKNDLQELHAAIQSFKQTE